ncbi:acetyltransferase [Novosphingobium sp. Rr 2-17]|uniref:GNAT family N-acetyltransferase n=1 Tax=Novosphingobium sp. Rr 2-17 TaxID=555793 RepID=UPI0002698BD0|nr:GNAT family N-acetyltransferase [Novosphingobium sp. Rr 2-17]EIZ78638.1 acetyltransferase [Novosphingobium sp. Rr 2-17]
MNDDVDHIMAVMSAAFDPAFGEAWNRRQVEDALTIGNCHYDVVGVDGLAPDEGNPAAGFRMSRMGFEEEELLLIAVVPNLRGRGLGLAMLETLRSDAEKRGARRLLLEMRKGNPAESLYRSFGFYSIGERREYYRTPVGDRIDAVTFAYDVPNDTSAQVQ